MRIGRLRRRISVQQRSTTQTSHGQLAATWSDILTGVPCDIKPLTGRELLAAQAINAEVTHQITVRYHALLATPTSAAGLRAVYASAAGNRIFNVVAAMNVDERNAVITILANEGLNQG